MERSAPHALPQSNDGLLLTSLQQCPAAVCLLSLLQPVRLCLRPFLRDEDVAYVLATSRSAAATLLAGYRFGQHVFTAHTAAELKRTVAFYQQRDMHILRLCLAADWSEPLADGGTGWPLLPASLLALTVGQHPWRKTSQRGRRCAANALLDGSEGTTNRLPSEEGSVSGYLSGQSDAFYRRIRLLGARHNHNRLWDVQHYDSSQGVFNLRILAGQLPRGLRFLQLNSAYNRPLDRGSLPDTLERLQFGECFNQPLAVSDLPSSLTHLVFEERYNRPLAGVLPAGLLRLRLSDHYYQPIQSGALPARLQQLSLKHNHPQPIAPGAIPHSVTHLRIDNEVGHVLQPGSIPHGVVQLALSGWLQDTLPPGMLPASLRRLLISARFGRPFELQVGSVPEGVELLAFQRNSAYQQRLGPGLIPASVVLLSLNKSYEQELMPGGVPETVRWVRLPRRYAEKDLSGVLSPSTRVVWW